MAKAAVSMAKAAGNMVKAAVSMGKVVGSMSRAVGVVKIVTNLAVVLMAVHVIKTTCVKVAKAAGSMVGVIPVVVTVDTRKKRQLFSRSDA